MEAATFTPTLHHDTYSLISPESANLSGRVVLITGATRGIGQALAVSFAKARVSGLILAARGDLIETAAAVTAAVKDAPKILCLNVDVANQESVELAASRSKQTFPQGIDIVINNAGFLEGARPVGEADVHLWWKSYEVNTKGSFLISRSFIPLLLSKPSGLRTIVLVTSVGALMVIPGMSGYNISKLAVTRLAEYLDAEYASQGLISFSIHPGGVDTELARGLHESMHAYLTETPELSADTILWLTKEKREWLAGRFVHAQWDMGEFEGRKAEVLEKGLLKVGIKV